MRHHERQTETARGDTYLNMQFLMLVDQWVPDTILKNTVTSCSKAFSWCFPGLTTSLQKNMDLLYKHSKKPNIHSLLPKTLQSYLFYLKTFLQMSRKSGCEIRNMFSDVSGRPVLRHLLSQNQGVILTGLHFGHPELGAACLAALGHRVSVVAYRSGDPAQNRFREQSRSRWNVNTLYTGRSSRTGVDIKTLRQQLGKNRILCVLGDPPGKKLSGDPLKLQGLFRDATLLSLRTGAPLLIGTVPHVSPPLQLKLSCPLLPDRIDGTFSERRDNLRKQLWNHAAGEVKKKPELWFRFH